MGYSQNSDGGGWGEVGVSQNSDLGGGGEVMQNMEGVMDGKLEGGGVPKTTVFMDTNLLGNLNV